VPLYQLGIQHGLCWDWTWPFRDRRWRL